MSKKQWGHGFHTGFSEGYLLAKQKTQTRGIQKQRIILDEDFTAGYDSALICPRCGGDYIHEIKTNYDLNVIRINFCCEQCGNYGNEPELQSEMQLCITTHKGRTYIWWEYFPA